MKKWQKIVWIVLVVMIVMTMVLWTMGPLFS